MTSKVQDPETVAGHMYRMAMMCFLFGGGETKCTSDDVEVEGSTKRVDRER